VTTNLLDHIVTKSVNCSLYWALLIPQSFTKIYSQLSE